MVSHKSGDAIDPVLVLRRVATTRILSWPDEEPTSGGICGAKYPVDSASRYCGRTARPWHFALTDPLRLQPPMAVGDLGLALPCELSACFPAPPDFSTDTFHNRSPHNWSIHNQRRGAWGKRLFSPLST